MRADAGLDGVVHGRRREVRAVEAAEHALEPAITEILAGGVLRLDHTIGIPNEQITGA
jgi:hypothetical protein